jgi:hypothetical protein
VPCTTASIGRMRTGRCCGRVGGERVAGPHERLGAYTGWHVRRAGHRRVRGARRCWLRWRRREHDGRPGAVRAGARASAGPLLGIVTSPPGSPRYLARLAPGRCGPRGRGGCACAATCRGGVARPRARAGAGRDVGLARAAADRRSASLAHARAPGAGARGGDRLDRVVTRDRLLGVVGASPGYTAAALVIDPTQIQSPLKLGADIVVHSATKADGRTFGPPAWRRRGCPRARTAAVAHATKFLRSRARNVRVAPGPAWLERARVAPGLRSGVS